MPARDTDLSAYLRNAKRVGSHTVDSGRFQRTVFVLAAKHGTRFHKLDPAAAFHKQARPFATAKSKQFRTGLTP